MNGQPESPAPAPPVPSATATGPAGEELGRLVHDVRLASEAERAEAEGRQRFLLDGWDERTDHQRELDMDIGEAVAAAERERAERAEAKLAAITTLCRNPAAFVGQTMGAGRVVPGDRVAARILAITGTGEEAGNG